MFMDPLKAFCSLGTVPTVPWNKITPLTLQAHTVLKI